MCMSDDLVQRLRWMADGDLHEEDEAICRQAADRIEALEAALREIAGAEAVWGPESWGRWHINISPIDIARRALEGK
jgi:hypothetical protein